MRVATNCLWVGLFAAVALYGLLVMLRAADPGFVLHGLLFLAFGIAAAAFTVRTALTPEPVLSGDGPNYNTAIVPRRRHCLDILGSGGLCRWSLDRPAARLPGTKFRSTLDEFRAGCGRSIRPR